MRVKHESLKHEPKHEPRVDAVGWRTWAEPAPPLPHRRAGPMTPPPWGSPAMPASPVQYVDKPVHQVASPVQYVNSPVYQVASPVQFVHSPVHHMRSPVQDIRSPVHYMPSPVQHVPSPVQHVPSPVQHVPSPVQHLPSPVQHVPSPVQHVRSPLHRTGSPALQIASPHYEQARPTAWTETPPPDGRPSSPHGAKRRRVDTYKDPDPYYDSRDPWPRTRDSDYHRPKDDHYRERPFVANRLSHKVVRDNEPRRLNHLRSEGHRDSEYGRHHRDSDYRQPAHNDYRHRGEHHLRHDSSLNHVSVRRTPPRRWDSPRRDERGADRWPQWDRRRDGEHHGRGSRDDWRDRDGQWVREVRGRRDPSSQGDRRDGYRHDDDGGGIERTRPVRSFDSRGWDERPGSPGYRPRRDESLLRAGPGPRGGYREASAARELPARDVPASDSGRVRQRPTGTGSPARASGEEVARGDDDDDEDIDDKALEAFLPENINGDGELPPDVAAKIPPRYRLSAKRIELVRQHVRTETGEELRMDLRNAETIRFVDGTFECGFKQQLQRAVNAEVTAAKKRKGGRRRRAAKAATKRSRMMSDARR